jgi:3',5'-cyclic AMP phosphodiesterase CpdA
MNCRVLKIGQVSDIHIGEDENLVQGSDVRANFQKALHSKSMEDIDLLVLSGDLANEDGEPGAYRFVSEQVKDFRVPVLVIPGITIALIPWPNFLTSLTKFMAENAISSMKWTDIHCFSWIAPAGQFLANSLNG